MAKKRKTGDHAEWDADSASRYMREQFAAEAAAVDSGIQDSAVAAVSDVGLYLPHLSLRTLFQRTCFPLERSMILYGPTGSNKSSLLYWFYRLFLINSGSYLHVELEDKDTPILRLSITNYHNSAGYVRRCESMDEFQSTVRHYVDWWKSKASAPKGPQRRVPFVIGIDSLVAKMTEEAARKVEADHGVTGRRFADEARSLSDWFKVVPGYLQQWPMSLIAVNHDKPRPGARPGTVQHITPGGSAPNYYATYKILVQHAGDLKQTASGWEGKRVKLKMDKCSMAADNREIEVEFVWCNRDDHRDSGRHMPVQLSLWNWDKATTQMLYNFVARRDKEGRRAAAVADILGIQRATAGRYYARGIDLGPSDAVPADQFARILESRRDVLDALEPQLGIHPSFRFTAGVDFPDQIKAAADRVKDLIPEAIPFDRDLMADDVTEPAEAEPAAEGQHGIE